MSFGELNPGLDLYESLKDKSDATVIDRKEFMPLAGEELVVKNIKTADNEEGFRFLMDEWIEQLIAKGVPSPYIELDVDEVVSHERSHREAALIGGFSVVTYGIHTSFEEKIAKKLFSTVHTFEHGMIPFISPSFPVRDITKLTMASVSAAPGDLSAGDLAQITAMGYDGVGDVAERVVHHNRTNITGTLMVPLSSL